MHWFLQHAALSPTSLAHSLPFGKKITYVTAASDKKKTITDCTGCNKSTASCFLHSRAKNHTFLVLPQGATPHPCTNPQLSQVPTPPTHKLQHSIRKAGRQTGDTLPNLQQNRLWGSAGALWSSLFTQFNRFRYNLLCQLGNCSQLGHLSLQQVAVCLSLTTASWGNCLKADCEEQSHGHISLDHVQP